MHSERYCEKLKSRFSQSGNKLFFVDGSKNRAFANVKSLLKNSSATSSLIIVRNEKTAYQVKRALFTGEEVTIITTSKEFMSLYYESSRTASKFKDSNKNVIIVLRDTEKRPVLHAKIDVIKGKEGEFNYGENAPYCVSDFLADARYPMVVIDETYEIFRFSIVASDKFEDYSPQKYDRIDLMGQSYFTPLDFSYKKVAKIVDSADNVILTSDILIDRDVISIYAGLSLINGFSLNEARTFCKKHSYNYNEEIDSVISSISYCCSDETLLSLCLNKTRNNPQKIPTNLDDLGAYLSGNLDYVTHEETFLRMVYGQAKKKYNLSVSSNEIIVRSFEEDNALADAVCDVFFSDTLKGEIESNLSTSHITEMTAQDIDELLKIINKYVEFCDFEPIGDNCKVVRIYHEESGFEDIMRRLNNQHDSAISAYSATYKGDDLVFKCIATKKLIDDQCVKLPLFIISEDAPNNVSEQLNRILERKVDVFALENEKLEKDDLVVMKYSMFEAIGNYYDVGSVIFFDVLADVNFFDTCIKKAIDMTKDTNVVVLASYDNLSGALADTWQDVVFKDEYKILPMRNTEVYIKGEKPHDYKDVIKDIDATYENVKNLVEGAYSGSVEELAQKYANVVASYTLGVSTLVNTVTDFEYIKQIAGVYTTIFANSVTICSSGREVFNEKRIMTDGKKSKGRAKYETLQEEKRMVFNICARFLHGTCQNKHKDCVDCENGGKYQINDYKTFSDSVKSFFAQTYQIMQKTENERRAHGGIIGGGAQSQLSVSLSEITDAQMQANEILCEIDKIGEKGKSVFYVSYDKVKTLRDLVQGIYLKVFEKYYNQLLAIYTNASEKMKSAFAIAGASAKRTMTNLQ